MDPNTLLWCSRNFRRINSERTNDLFGHRDLRLKPFVGCWMGTERLRKNHHRVVRNQTTEINILRLSVTLEMLLLSHGDRPSFELFFFGMYGDWQSDWRLQEATCLIFKTDWQLYIQQRYNCEINDWSIGFEVEWIETKSSVAVWWLLILLLNSERNVATKKNWSKLQKPKIWCNLVPT